MHSISRQKRANPVPILYCIVEGLPRVRKANIRMEFNVYVNSKSDDSVQRRRVCNAQLTHEDLLE